MITRMTSTRPKRLTRNSTPAPPPEDDCTVVRQCLDKMITAVDTMERFQKTRDDIKLVQRGLTTRTMEEVLSESRWHEMAAKARKECPLGSTSKKRQRQLELQQKAEEDEKTPKKPCRPPPERKQSSSKKSTAKKKAEMRQRAHEAREKKLELIQSEKSDTDGNHAGAIGRSSSQSTDKASSKESEDEYVDEEDKGRDQPGPSDTRGSGVRVSSAAFDEYKSFFSRLSAATFDEFCAAMDSGMTKEAFGVRFEPLPMLSGELMSRAVVEQETRLISWSDKYENKLRKQKAKEAQEAKNAPQLSEIHGTQETDESDRFSQPPVLEPETTLEAVVSPPKLEREISEQIEKPITENGVSMDQTIENGNENQETEVKVEQTENILKVEETENVTTDKVDNANTTEVCTQKVAEENGLPKEVEIETSEVNVAPDLANEEKQASEVVEDNKQAETGVDEDKNDLEEEKRTSDDAEKDIAPENKEDVVSTEVNDLADQAQDVEKATTHVDDDEVLPVIQNAIDKVVEMEETGEQDAVSNVPVDEANDDQQMEVDDDEPTIF